MTRAALAQALEELVRRDKDLGRAYARAGPPPLRARTTGFATLLGAICAQQISTAAARTVRERLQARAGEMTPENILGLREADLRAAGLSRQKASYAQGLAEAILSGGLNLRRVHRMADEDAIAEITRIKGLGRWSAEMYLLFALRRPDIWPVDDLGVVIAVQHVKGLNDRPGRAQMAEIGEAWRPWRSAAARLMWHYLHHVRGE